MGEGSLNIFLLGTALYVYCVWDRVEFGKEKNGLNRAETEDHSEKKKTRKRRAEDWSVDALH